MQEVGHVLVVQLDGIACNKFVLTLRQFRWRVSLCESPDHLLARLDDESADAIVLFGAGQGLSALILSLRLAAPATRVVWQPSSDCPRVRIAALDAGAHACVPPNATDEEWDAVLRNLIRGGRPALALRPRWRVDARGRMLAGPGGERLPLTHTERAFFVSLLSAPGQCLPREGFFPDAARDPQDGARRVDVLVSRLRTKARRRNFELPVLAVRGWGYMLLPHAAAGPG